MSHEFKSDWYVDHIAEYWVAKCSCGWKGVYTHAFEKYAREDHDFHLEQVREHELSEPQTGEEVGTQTLSD